MEKIKITEDQIKKVYQSSPEIRKEVINRVKEIESTIKVTIKNAEK